MYRFLPRLVLMSAGLLLLAVLTIDELLRSAVRDGDGDEAPEPDEFRDLVDTLAGAGPFGTLTVALKTADLVSTLESDGPFTVLAPTDDAFVTLGETLDELLADPDRLARVLKLHVVPGHLPSEELASRAELDTLAGESLSVTGADPIRVAGASVVDPDLVASNGVIHGIDRVLELPASTDA